MSDRDLFSESKLDYNPLSPCGPLNELHTSCSGSDIESDNQEDGRRQLTSDEFMAEAFSKKKRLSHSVTKNAVRPAEKRPCQQTTTTTRANKHTRLDVNVRSKSHSSSCHRPYPVLSPGPFPGPSPKSVEVDDEVKSSLKEITSLLNTVVKRVENVEDELQRQRTTGPSSSRDSTNPNQSQNSYIVS